MTEQLKVTPALSQIIGADGKLHNLTPKGKMPEDKSVLTGITLEDSKGSVTLDLFDQRLSVICKKGDTIRAISIGEEGLADAKKIIDQKLGPVAFDKTTEDLIKLYQGPLRPSGVEITTTKSFVEDVCDALVPPPKKLPVNAKMTIREK